MNTSHRSTEETNQKLILKYNIDQFQAAASKFNDLVSLRPKIQSVKYYNKIYCY